jgi:hypothetical protein
VPPLLGCRDDVADGGDTQHRIAYQYHAVEDAEMGQEVAVLLYHPLVLGAVGGDFQVERPEVAAGPLVVDEQVQDRLHVLTAEAWQQRGNSRSDTRRHLAVFSEQKLAYLWGKSACLKPPESN